MVLLPNMAAWLLGSPFIITEIPYGVGVSVKLVWETVTLVFCGCYKAV